MNIKALTLHNPWAQLIADGRKKIETRSWPTGYRGPLAIHAGKVCDEDFAIDCGYKPKTLVQQAVICIVQLVECVEMTDAFIKQASKDEKRFGDFDIGRFAWILEKPSKIEPILMRGYQGLWSADVETSSNSSYNR